MRVDTDLFKIQSRVGFQAGLQDTPVDKLWKEVILDHFAVVEAREGSDEVRHDLWEEIINVRWAATDADRLVSIAHSDAGNDQARVMEFKTRCNHAVKDLRQVVEDLRNATITWSGTNTLVKGLKSKLVPVLKEIYRRVGVLDLGSGSRAIWLLLRLGGVASMVQPPVQNNKKLTELEKAIEVKMKILDACINS